MAIKLAAEPSNLFTDQQKQSLATEAGYSWPFNPDMFNREDNAQTGESTMYMKMGDIGRFYGKNPMTAQVTRNPIATQASNMKTQFGGQPWDAAYNAYLKALPSSKQTYYDEIGMSTGIYSEIEAITQQQMEMMKSMTGNQAAIFSAKNPDGTPVDPRVMVAQYKANMQSATDRVDQLRQLETVYKSQLKVLGDAEFDKAQKQAETAKTALLYLKDLNDQANKDRDAQFREKELAQRGSQFNQEMAQKKSEFQQEQNYRYSDMVKPQLVQDVSGEYQWATYTAPSGQISSQTFSSASQKNKNVELDSSAMTGFQKAMDAMQQQGVDIVIGSTTRSTEEQKKLRAAYEAGTGGIAAPAGQSKHEKWLGIDIYSDSKFSAPTKAQIDAMEANGWKHMAIPGDLGHFEYQGSNNGMTKTGIMGATKWSKEPSYEDALTEFASEVEKNGYDDLSGALDKILSAFPSKERAKVQDDFFNVAGPTMKKKIQGARNEEAIKEEIDTTRGHIPKLTGKEDTASYLSLLESKIAAEENSADYDIRKGTGISKDEITAQRMFRVLKESGFFDKFEGGSATNWGNDDQWDAAQEYFEGLEADNGAPYDFEESIDAGILKTKAKGNNPYWAAYHSIKGN